MKEASSSQQTYVTDCKDGNSLSGDVKPADKTMSDIGHLDEKEGFTAGNSFLQPHD